MNKTRAAERIEQAERDLEAALADAARLRAFLERYPFPMSVDDALKRAEQAERERDKALDWAATNAKQRDEARALLSAIVAHWPLHGASDGLIARLAAQGVVYARPVSNAALKDRAKKGADDAAPTD